jgi:imidazolonepropionase-like amidohydrolase
MLTAQTDVTLPQFPLDDLRAVVDAAHDAGLPVTGHAHAVRAVEDCVAAGVDGIEHCSNITGTGQHATPELLERLAASGIAVCPTLGRFPGVDYAPHVTDVMTGLGLSEETVDANVRDLIEAGVRIVGGADSGIYPAKAHGVLPWGLVAYVRCGASVTEMLASGTGRAADVVGLGDRTGRLRPGLDADLLLLDGDVRTDPLAVTRVRTVVSRGRVVRSDV